MKLITHNMLTSKCLKEVVTGYPLGLIVKEMKVEPSDINKEFLIRIIPKLDYNVLLAVAKQIGHEGNLPDSIMQNYENNDEFLKDIHHALLEVDIIEGELVCPETCRKFQITDGIPNMLVTEDEI